MTTPTEILGHLDQMGLDDLRRVQRDLRDLIAQKQQAKFSSAGDCQRDLVDLESQVEDLIARMDDIGVNAARQTGIELHGKLDRLATWLEKDASEERTATLASVKAIDDTLLQYVFDLR